MRLKEFHLSFREANSENPWKEIKDKVGKLVEVTINNITDKAIFADLDSGLTGMLALSRTFLSRRKPRFKKV